MKKTRHSIPERNLLRSATCVSHANEQGFLKAGLGCALRSARCSLLAAGIQRSGPETGACQRSMSSPAAAKEDGQDTEAEDK